MVTSTQNRYWWSDQYLDFASCRLIDDQPGPRLVVRVRARHLLPERTGTVIRLHTDGTPKRPPQTLRFCERSDDRGHWKLSYWSWPGERLAPPFDELAAVEAVPTPTELDNCTIGLRFEGIAGTYAIEAWVRPGAQSTGSVGLGDPPNAPDVSVVWQYADYLRARAAVSSSSVSISGPVMTTTGKEALIEPLARWQSEVWARVGAPEPFLVDALRLLGNQQLVDDTARHSNRFSKVLTAEPPPPIDRVEVAAVEIRGGWRFVVRSYAGSKLCGTDNAESLQEVLDICARLGVVPELLLVPLEGDPTRIFIVEAHNLLA